MTNSPTIDSSAFAPSDARRPISLFSWLLLLLVASAALLLYIGFQRDLRLKQYAQAQGRFYSESLTERVGESRALPLNLDPQVSPEQKTRMLTMNWLPREDALLLRQTPGRVLVAHTPLLSRILAPNGRMCIFFENGKFHEEWLAESDYDRLSAAQSDLLRKLRGEK